MTAPRTSTGRGSLGSLRRLALAAAVAVLPFALLGESFERQLADWIAVPRPPAAVAALVTLALAGDILLPVPSSVLCSLAVGPLGMPITIAAGTLGLSLSCAIGFAIGRLWSEPGAAPPPLLSLAATRAVPLVAEATVVLAGSSSMTWRPFAAAVVPANLLVVTLYTGIGRWGLDTGRIRVAVIGSIVLPVLLSTVVWSLRRSANADPVANDDQPDPA